LRAAEVGQAERLFNQNRARVFAQGIHAERNVRDGRRADVD